MHDSAAVQPANILVSHHEDRASAPPPEQKRREFMQDSGSDQNRVSTLLGFVAVTAATINVVGGFVVTDRMLGLFKGRKKPAPGGSRP